MWRILYFAHLPRQYRLFGILFHVQTNFCRFIEYTLVKAADENSYHTFFFHYRYLIQVKKVSAQYRHIWQFQFSRNLLVKFCYKIKQPAPPSPAFVKVVEIIQKRSDFPLFCPMICPPDFLTLLWHWFKRNITCYLKVTIQRGFWKIVDLWFFENSQEIFYSRVR